MARHPDDRGAIEKHTPKGTLPEREFLGDFSEEAAILVGALKRVLMEGSQGRAAMQ